MRVRCVLLLSLVALLGCGEEAPAAAPATSTLDPDAAVATRECQDEDGDGFGTYCELGQDCDDEDPEETDQCYRCTVPALNCECEPGTRAVHCDPPDIEVEGGRLVCSEGTRYCRDGLWSDCEVIGQYVFVATRE